MKKESTNTGGDRSLTIMMEHSSSSVSRVLNPASTVENALIKIASSSSPFENMHRKINSLLPEFSPTTNRLHQEITE
ncbi:MAG: hypothetical protein BV458_08395 [Thermoplasmata archaeon M9B2D]|nr:MAG: hypothetical protein BV458_08395 [Thermoplasmata archaeon M9B2D]